MFLLDWNLGPAESEKSQIKFRQIVGNLFSQIKTHTIRFDSVQFKCTDFICVHLIWVNTKTIFVCCSKFFRMSALCDDWYETALEIQKKNGIITSFSQKR